MITMLRLDVYSSFQKMLDMLWQSYTCILYLNTIYDLLIWIYRRLTITTQERLDEMTRISSTLNKVLGSNLACIGHAATLKFL